MPVWRKRAEATTKKWEKIKTKMSPSNRQNKNEKFEESMWERNKKKTKVDMVICDTRQTWDGLVLKVTRVQAMNVMSALVNTKKIYM